MGYFIYNYPLQKLVERINDINNTIDGQKFIQYMNKKHVQYQWIKSTTGWNERIIYQIESALVEYKLTQYDEMVLKIMGKHQLKINKIKDRIEDLDMNCKPLHRYDSNDISARIKWFIFKDINYNKYVLQTMQILTSCLLSGENICNLGSGAETITEKKILGRKYFFVITEKEFSKFMTDETFNIIMNKLNKWKEEDPESMQTKSAAEIGYIIYNYPIDNLLQRVNDINDAINGQKFIEYYKAKNKWMKDATGMNQEEIYQIESMLFRNKSFLKLEITQKMKKIFNQRFQQSIGDVLCKQILKFDVEQLYLRMKRGKDIHDFVDAMINTIHMLLEDEADGDDDFVRKIYDAIAECFTINYTIEFGRDKLSLDKHDDWVCSNCGNYNFHNYVSGEMCCDLSVCRLCGVTKRNSIVIKIRSNASYFMVDHVTSNSDQDMKNNQPDEIDLLMKEVQQKKGICLVCPNRSDNKACPSILRLAKHLIYYKKWINNVYKKTGKDNIDNTVQIYVDKFKNDDLYKKIFIQSAKSIQKINENQIQMLTKMIDENVNNIGNVQTFLGLKRPEFAKIIRKETKIKPAVSSKLHKAIFNSLLKQIQTEQLGEFLSNLNAESIDKDYHHILNTHVNKGNKMSVEHIFRFFGNIVHYDDCDTDIKQCRSFNRKEQRIKSMQSKTGVQNVDETKENSHKVWSLNQYFIQSQLDVIHAYLVHTNWKEFISRYSRYSQYNNTNTSTDDKEELIALNLDMNSSLTENKKKYVTESSESDMINYGFGIDFPHPHLSPRFACLKDEALNNAISAEQFDHLLIKAIRMHRIALSEDHENQLICKYYSGEYNIIRNEPIGIKHILAIIIYTDMTLFCTSFRRTYRRIGNETTDKEVEKRHIELYFYSHCLYTAVEFYGQPMDKNMKVFHGLNQMMKFESFTAHFNQPISTTTDEITAQQFTQGVGIRLTLRSDPTSLDKTSMIPKYLGVSWSSDFPHEDELLFYGANVRFQIYNIIEADSNKSHLKELLLLNAFQQMVKNQSVNWSDKKLNKKLNNKKLIDALVISIRNQQEINKQGEEKQKEETNKTLTKYGNELFSYFCNNPKRTWITIKDYTSLPLTLQHALFENERNSDVISLIPVALLFKNLKEITLNELDVRQLTDCAKKYIVAVKKYIEYATQMASSSDFNLETITFQSKSQKNRKENSILKNLATEYSYGFQSKYHWSIKYNFHGEETHNLIFNKNNFNISIHCFIYFLILLFCFNIFNLFCL
eukprot:121522_1